MNRHPRMGESLFKRVLMEWRVRLIANRRNGREMEELNACALLSSYFVRPIRFDLI